LQGKTLNVVADFIGRINIIEVDGQTKLVRPEHLKISKENGQFKRIITGEQVYISIND
jgi:hypothetical protein